MRGWEGKIAIFNSNRRISWKLYEVGPWLLRIINGKSQVARYLAMKKVDDNCRRLDTMHECDRQTERQTPANG